mmetsp:Transcript_11867/g.35178  ORF Transcript_11867/g.35178 Transcript_11867/m.35178 type:complete len:231 (+) Transcript_11867:110-802(+)
MKALVLLKMERPSSMAATMVAKLLSARIMSEAPLATAVPAPIATPMSARLSAGASLTPSPVIAVTMPMDWRRETSRSLWEGSVRAKRLHSPAARLCSSSLRLANSRPVSAVYARAPGTPAGDAAAASAARSSSPGVMTPACLHTASAVCMLSPVTTMTRTPAERARAMAGPTSGRTGSVMPVTPRSVSPDSTSAMRDTSASSRAPGGPAGPKVVRMATASVRRAAAPEQR